MPQEKSSSAPKAVILRYELVGCLPYVDIPFGADFLTVKGGEYGVVHAFFLVAQGRPTQRRYFEIVSEGVELSAEPGVCRYYLGMARMQDTLDERHVFERPDLQR